MTLRNYRKYLKQKMNDQLKFYEQKLNYEIDPSDLFQALDQNEVIVVVDARSSEAYKSEHIPGALNIPHREMSPESTSDLDNDKLYIVYCDGIGCNASTKGAINLLKLGFEVKELIGGLEWWKKDGYQTEGSGANPGKDLRCAC